MGERIYLNDDWRFTESYNEHLLSPEFNHSEMKAVRLPHTCKETPFNYFDENLYQMVSGYRKIIEAPKSWEGKKIILTIEGAAHESEVFLNGESIGGHKCGYTAFSLDVSEKLNFEKENVLVIRVDSREDKNLPPFGFVIDYMTYGGIYRDVYLDIYSSDFLQDVFVESK
jgi:beta-galactosidase